MDLQRMDLPKPDPKYYQSLCKDKEAKEWFIRYQDELVRREAKQDHWDDQRKTQELIKESKEKTEKKMTALIGVSTIISLITIIILHLSQLPSALRKH